VAWSKAVNAKGGIHGHPVEVIVKDDQAVAAKSLAAVKDLIENDHVVALVGNHESGLDSTWAKYADSKGVPVVGGVATGAAYSTDPNFFPIGNTNLTGSAAYSNAAKLFGKSSVSLVYCAEVPACKQADGLMSYFANALGLKHPAGLAISASSPSYAAQCQNLKDAGADAVFTATARATAESFIKQCATQGYKPLFIDSPQNWEASATTDPVWEGAALASDAPLWFGDGPGTADYLAAMKQYEPTAVLNSSGTAGWYSGKLFEAALDKAFDNGATGDVTSQTVYDGLYALGPNFDLDGIVAPVTYTKGKPAVQQVCAWYAQVKDGKLTAPHGYDRICLDGIKPPPASS
jgi:branched-chain amino acid transport system substrate-binding protein